MSFPGRAARGPPPPALRDDAAPHGVEDHLGHRVQVQLLEHARAVRLDGGRRDAQDGRHRLVAVSLGHQLEHLALAPGELSDVIASQEGYQIIKLVDKKKVKADVSFAMARDEIEAILSYRRSQAVVDSVLTALREKAKIELKPDAYFEPAGK